MTTNIFDNGHQFWNVLKVKFNENDLENFYASLDLYFHHFIYIYREREIFLL